MGAERLEQQGHESAGRGRRRVGGVRNDARAPRDTPADLISVNTGNNLANTDLTRLRAFGPAVHGFLELAADPDSRAREALVVHPDLPTGPRDPRQRTRTCSSAVPSRATRTRPAGRRRVMQLNGPLRRLAQESEGQDPEPSTCGLDAQSVNTSADVAPTAGQGIDAGKETVGRRYPRPLLAAQVTLASFCDNTGGIHLLPRQELGPSTESRLRPRRTARRRRPQERPRGSRSSELTLTQALPPPGQARWANRSM
ncbi:hypothetical protein ACFRQM_46030 [Streptomyces sp. NPDC056831]|uniref:hypothetical protein n=1 Tax=Streptomyces sp. NPDC056831 TaxID=3345954 RepID=UPI00368E8C56